MAKVLISVFIGILCNILLVFSVPNIDSIQGDLIDNGVVIVSGSNFGITFRVLKQDFGIKTTSKH